MSILIKALKQAERDHIARSANPEPAPAAPARASHPLSLEPVELQTREEAPAPCALPVEAESPEADEESRFDVASNDVSPVAAETPVRSVDESASNAVPVPASPESAVSHPFEAVQAHAPEAHRLVANPTPIEAAPPAPELSPSPSARSKRATSVGRSAAEKLDEREAARKLFTPAPASHGSRRGRWIAMAAIIGLAVGGFLAWQGAIPGVADLKGVFAPAPVQAPPPSLADRLVQQADKAEKRPAAASHRPASIPAPASATPTQAPRLLAAAAPAPAPARPENSAPAGAKVETEKPASAASAIHVRADSRPEHVGGLLLQAYAAAGLGDGHGAQVLYQQAIDLDPNNADAWNGLAALTANSGDGAGAARLYQRALEIDPGDAIAMGGLLGLQSGADPQEVETRLRVLIARDGAQPALQAALGRLLARQTRWLDAQEAFYQAWAADPSQPDVAFNLAVALEHIRQAPAALGFYKRALELARNHAARFDQNAARQRIAALDSAQK